MMLIIRENLFELLSTSIKTDVSGTQLSVMKWQGLLVVEEADGKPVLYWQLVADNGFVERRAPAPI